MHDPLCGCTVHCTEVRFGSLLSSGFITAIVVNLPERKMAKCTSVRWLSGLKRHYLADLQRLWEWFKPYCCWNSLFIIIQGISYWSNKTNTLCGIKSAKLKGKVIKFEIMRLIVVYLALVKPVTKIVFSLINWWCQDFIGILENPIQWLAGTGHSYPNLHSGKDPTCISVSVHSDLIFLLKENMSLTHT